MSVPTTTQARYEYTPLATVVRDLAYRVGDFTLASGAKSTEYVNVKNALLHPHARRRIAEAMERLIKSTAGLLLRRQPLDRGRGPGLRGNRRLPAATPHPDPRKP